MGSLSSTLVTTAIGVGITTQLVNSRSSSSNFHEYSRSCSNWPDNSPPPPRNYTPKNSDEIEREALKSSLGSSRVSNSSTSQPSGNSNNHSSQSKPKVNSRSSSSNFHEYSRSCSNWPDNSPPPPRNYTPKNSDEIEREALKSSLGSSRVSNSSTSQPSGNSNNHSSQSKPKVNSRSSSSNFHEYSRSCSNWPDNSPPPPRNYTPKNSDEIEREALKSSLGSSRVSNSSTSQPSGNSNNHSSQSKPKVNSRSSSSNFHEYSRSCSNWPDNSPPPPRNYTPKNSDEIEREALKSSLGSSRVSNSSTSQPSGNSNNHSSQSKPKVNSRSSSSNFHEYSRSCSNWPDNSPPPPRNYTPKNSDEIEREALKSSLGSSRVSNSSTSQPSGNSNNHSSQSKPKVNSRSSSSNFHEYSRSCSNWPDNSPPPPRNYTPKNSDEIEREALKSSLGSSRVSNSSTSQPSGNSNNHSSQSKPKVNSRSSSSNFHEYSRSCSNWPDNSPPPPRNYTPKNSDEIEREALKSSLGSSRVSNSSTSQPSGNSNNHSSQSKPKVNSRSSSSNFHEYSRSCSNWPDNSPPPPRNYTPKNSDEIEREALKSSLGSSRVSNSSTSQPSGNSNNHSSQSKPKVNSRSSSSNFHEYSRSCSNWPDNSPPPPRNYTPKNSDEIEREALKSSLGSSRVSNSSTSQPSGNSNNHSSQSKPKVDSGSSSHDCHENSRSCSNQVVSRQVNSPPATRNYTPKSKAEIEREVLKSSLESSRVSNSSTSQVSGNSNNLSSQSKPSVSTSSNHQSEKRNYGHKSSDVIQRDVGASSNNPNELLDSLIDFGFDCNKSNTNAVSSGGTSNNLLNINKNFNEPSRVTKKVFSSDDEKHNADIMIKHDVFLKKLAASFNVDFFSRNRGFFCSVCGIYDIFFKRNINCPLKHHETEMHLQNVLNKNNINTYYCKSCKAEFYSDINFWVDHLNMEFHKFFFEKMSKEPSYSKSNANSKNKKPNRNEGAFGTDTSLSAIPPISLNDVLSPLEENSSAQIIDLNLKTTVLLWRFLQILENSDKKKYCFYCCLCDLWMDNNKVWQDHNRIHEHCLGFKETLTNCASCRLMISGSNTLKQFHCSDKQHETFKQLLYTQLKKTINSSDANVVSYGNEDKTTGSLDASEEKKSKIYALLLKGLPPKTKRNKLFNVMKDFGRVGEIILNFTGPNTAKVTFKWKFTALNIVNNGVPIKVDGREVDVSLIE